MSNLGLERHLQTLKLSLVRTPVGDRYVLEHMREHGYNLGGEQSGHIILSDYTTTGDGFVAALQILAVVAALLTATLDYVAHDKRTRRFRRIRCASCAQSIATKMAAEPCRNARSD